ncbi:MAG: hypothetical protein ACTSRI_20870 [Promethearchaeota archaeon]
MSKEIKGIVLSRLIVLITIILVPIIIFLIFIFVDFHLWFTNNPTLNFWIINVLCPLVFSVSWFFFLILFANRFSETIESIDKITSVVPTRLMMFFGLTAIYILFIFVFPLITPIISILSFTSMAWRLTTYKKKSWDDSGVSFITKLTMALSAILPIFCFICILPDYLKLAAFLWEDIWLPLLDWIYIFSYCLCTALAIGSLFILLSNSGISEYEQFYVDSSKSKSIMHIKIAELFLFVFFLFLAVNKFEIIDFFYTMGFVIVVLVAIVNFFQGKKKISSFKSHILGYILAAVFMGSNLLIFTVEISELLSYWSLLLSAALFIFAFFYTFLTLDDI